MKNYLLLLLIAPLFTIAQTKKNGTIYVEHPGIELVKEFDKAFTSGDVEKLKTLVTEDFRYYNGLSTNFYSNNGGNVNQLVNNVSYWNNQLDDFSIESRGSAYPDAFEFKGDVIWIYTYDILSGYDKENGFKIKTPYDRSILLNKEGNKIHRIIESFNQAHIEKYNNSFKTVENGKIYRDHPYIGVVRKIMAHFEQGNIDRMYDDYLPNARLFDINLPFGESMSIEEHKKTIQNLYDAFEVVSVNESGYPDLMQYNGDGISLISWWVIILKNKISKEEIKVYLHNDLTLNDEGKVMRSVDYYNGALLN